MGELHLEIYVERMRREYGVIVSSGKPRVAYRETITERADFYHTHKKQTGGAGQFARVIGYVEPIPFDPENGQDREFVNTVMGGNIPHNYIPACEKVCRRIPLTGLPRQKLIKHRQRRFCVPCSSRAGSKRSKKARSRETRSLVLEWSSKMVLTTSWTLPSSPFALRPSLHSVRFTPRRNQLFWSRS